MFFWPQLLQKACYSLAFMEFQHHKSSVIIVKVFQLPEIILQFAVLLSEAAVHIHIFFLS
jgi:uncharacterized membrane protein YGL010W